MSNDPINPEIPEPEEVLLTAMVELIRVADGVLKYIKERFPDDFGPGKPGFQCPHHIALEAAVEQAKAVIHGGDPAGEGR